MDDNELSENLLEIHESIHAREYYDAIHADATFWGQGS